MNIYKNMTQLHVKQVSETGQLTVHTYDPTEGHFLHYNVGFIPNLGETLTFEQVDEFNAVLAQLNMVQKYRIVPDGLQVLDDKNRIILDSLVFNHQVGTFGLVLYQTPPSSPIGAGRWDIQNISVHSMAAGAQQNWLGSQAGQASERTGRVPIQTEVKATRVKATTDDLYNRMVQKIKAWKNSGVEVEPSWLDNPLELLDWVKRQRVPYIAGDTTFKRRDKNRGWTADNTVMTTTYL